MVAIAIPIYLTVLLFLFVVLLIYFYFKSRFSYWERKKVPFLCPRTPLGHLKPIILGRECLSTNLANIYTQFRKKDAKFGGYYILTDPIFIIVDPNLMKQMLVSDFQHFNERGMFVDEEKEPLSAHMFAIEYERWHSLRRKFSPTFTPSKMKTMFPLILDCTDNLIEILKKPSENQEPIDIYEVLARFTTDNIVSCAFGLDSNSLNNPNPEFRKCGMKFAQKSIAQSLSMSLALYSPWVLKLFNQSYIDPEITQFFLKVLKETVDYREKNKFEREDMLNLLIKLKNNEVIDDDSTNDGVGISFNDLAAQAFIFFLGGFETSATTLTFALYELSLNKEIQEKLRKDVIETTKKYNGNISYESIYEMAYLDNVVQETLRKYPPIGHINRRCSENYRVPGTDIILEKGTRVAGSILGIHRDEKYFENPLVFDPDRFSEKRRLHIKTGTFIPWGLGPKGCIGMRFAIQQTKIGLASLIKNYKFTVDPKTKIPLNLCQKTFVNVFESTLWLQAKKV